VIAKLFRGFTSAGESLKRHWSSHDVDINAGVSKAQLDSFESKHRVVLPEDLRDYFLCVNGMPQDVLDDGMIRFWMLEELQPLSQGPPAFRDPSYIRNPETLFLFADYSLWAHAYAIRLESNSVQLNQVVIIGYESPVTVSKSFSEFVDMYLTNKDLLH
jgi:hypothetical protein